MTLSLAPGPKSRAAFRGVALAALIAAFAQVTLGGVVRVTDAGLGCPDWPLCHGRIIPPFDLATLIEYSHRLSASVVGILVLTTAVLGWAVYRGVGWVVVPSVLGLVLVIVAAALGGVTVLTELAWEWVLVHLAVGELLVACMVVVTVVSWRAREMTSVPETGPVFDGKHNLLVMATLAGVFVLLLSGSYMVGYGAGSSCGTWPLCRGSLLPGGEPFLIHMAHRFLAAMVGVLIVATAMSAWSRRAPVPGLARAAPLLMGVFAIQVVVGAVMVWTGFGSQVKALHLSVATLVWMALVFVAALAYTPQRFEIHRAIPGIRRASGLERLTS